jgi:diketogulonate reductase-like aldo/keto reductase/GNAT superfamily N-acetyltransferase
MSNDLTGHFSFNDMTLRRAEDHDIAELVHIINKAYSYQDLAKGAPRTNRDHLAKRISETDFYVLKSSDRITGCIYIEPHETSLHFGLLTIIPNRRGTGLGASMMNAVIEYARSESYKYLELDYMSLAPWLKRYYEKYGFTETGEVAKWGSIDLIRMRLDLGYNHPMTIFQETLTLNNDTKIPVIGFGTWQIPEGAEAYDSTAFALKSGYRHIDTALVYGNENSVGKAIADSGIAREEIFLTTKLPADIKTYDGALEAFEMSVAALGVEYVDLYLIHAPWPWTDRGGDYTQGNILAWKALETIYASGRAKAIGVSNFSVTDLQAILENGTVVPAANQIKFFIGNTEIEEVTAFCQDKGILIEAYSPLATGRILDKPEVIAIAEKYGKSVAQISIRYTIQRGTVTLPKSTHEQYILENADVDFVINDDDMAYLMELKDLVDLSQPNLNKK